MYIFRKNLKSLAAAAVLTAALGAAPVVALAQEAAKPAGQEPAKPATPAKQMKPGEYELYNAILVDLGKNDFTKALTDYDTWKQKFPNSDYATDGKVLEIRALAGAKQPTKALDLAGELLAGDIDKEFPDPKSGPGVVLQVLVTASQAVLQTQGMSPTPQELDTAKKAATMLISYNRKAEGYTDAQWTQLHTQVDPIAKTALYYIAVEPGVEALQKKDYDTAETDFRNAMKEYPDNAQLAANLGATLVGEYIAKTHVEKFPEALYYYARAASVDATAGGVTKDWQANVDKSLATYYKQYHGSDEGLADLKALAAKSATPPDGFTVKTGAEVEKEKHDAFVAEHPNLARWLEIKKALTDGGDDYFKANMQDAAMPLLKGTVLEGKPACYSREIVVAISDATTPEVTIKLDTPVRGKPTAGSVITWTGGIAKAFSATPFNLTMEMEQAKIEGLEKGPCATPPARKGPAPATKKKK